MRAADHHTAMASAIRALAAEAHPACLLDCQNIFLFVNQPWDRFAEENGGAPTGLGAALIGTPWGDHLAGDDIRRYHGGLLARAIKSDGARAHQVVQVSESNSPTEARLIATRFDPVIARDWGEPMGIVVVHAVVRVRPIDEVYQVVSGEERLYRDDEERVVQCSCCRRTRQPASGCWDFVPSLVQTPPHGARWEICDLCLELHYPGMQPEFPDA
jgi:hypothetical protein